MKSQVPEVRTNPSQSQRQDSPKAVVFLVLLLGLGVALALGAVLLFTRASSPAEKTPLPTATSTPTPSPTAAEVPIKTGKTGLSLVQDQKNALAAAQVLLQEAGKDPQKLGISRRIAALDDNDLSQVTSTLPSLVRFPSQATPGLRAETYQALISLYGVLTRGGDVARHPVKAISPSAFSTVFLDSQLGVAYVPLDAFTGKQTAFSLQMVWVDGEWKLAPYSLLETVRLSATLAASGTAATPSPTATR